METVYDFPVELQPVYLFGNTAPVRGHKAIVRTDTNKALEIVSDVYKLFTHKQAIEVTENFIKAFGKHKVVDTMEKEGLRFVRTCVFESHATEVREKKVGDVVNFVLSIWNSYDRKSSVKIRIGARVLKCLNGMTVPGGMLDVSFRHTENGLANIELPEPEKVISIFGRASEQWNDWAGTSVSSAQRDAILHHALTAHVIGERILDKHPTLLNPDVNNGLSFWQYFNNFTNVITHHLPKLQLTAKIVRLDRLNEIFTGVLHGKPEPRFNDEENE